MAARAALPTQLRVLQEKHAVQRHPVAADLSAAMASAAGSTTVRRAAARASPAVGRRTLSWSLTTRRPAGARCDDLESNV